MKSTTPLQFVAYIEHVKEVALYGTADLAFWRKELAKENLFPYNDHGRVGILISVPQVVWKGARFNELSVSVGVSEREDGSTPDGLFLPHAFNSLRAFAWMERVFFQTPYFYADVQVTEKPPARFAVKHGAETAFEARMSGERAPARAEVEHFEGPVYLPGGKYFLARISGMTDFYPFAAQDTLSIHSREKVFQQLAESNFSAVEWRIRGDAVHGKGKTLSRKRV
ncbi:MAG: hypothetical protein HUU38_00935 [Anaerolineales bacterium]|nr:hypothetical protein [Anaerolineales bacterium]